MKYLFLTLAFCLTSFAQDMESDSGTSHEPTLEELKMQAEGHYSNTAYLGMGGFALSALGLYFWGKSGELASEFEKNYNMDTRLARMEDLADEKLSRIKARNPSWSNEQIMHQYRKEMKDLRKVSKWSNLGRFAHLLSLPVYIGAGYGLFKQAEIYTIINDQEPQKQLQQDIVDPENHPKLQKSYPGDYGHSEAAGY